MWIDTHCHLDAPEFAADRAAVYQRAQAAQVDTLVVPAVTAANFAAVKQLADWPGAVYALGIHPLYVDQTSETDLAILRSLLEAERNSAHSKLVAVGEIGLDFYVPDLDREKQVRFFQAQLRLARELDLPVLLHIRRAQDQVLKELRRIKLSGGIAHAFNGSQQQAEQFIALGFKLGFGGALTFPRALQIRRLATTLPLHSIVLETDAPDIPPAWAYSERNSPEHLPRIGAVLAELRQMPLSALAEATNQNARMALPRLASAIP